ncbi:hypothetical protein ANO11243_000470 [Dothideomycetidae sp. 11243]|nr:hypothetical protein ANO11243_000470 [fungal sp. No.11243]
MNKSKTVHTYLIEDADWSPSVLVIRDSSTNSVAYTADINDKQTTITNSTSTTPIAETTYLPMTGEMRINFQDASLVLGRRTFSSRKWAMKSQDGTKVLYWKQKGMTLACTNGWLDLACIKFDKPREGSKIVLEVFGDVREQVMVSALVLLLLKARGKGGMKSGTNTAHTAANSSSMAAGMMAAAAASTAAAAASAGAAAGVGGGGGVGC